MDYTTFILIKAGALGLAAFCWGVYCGATGRPLWREPEEPERAPRRSR